MISSKDPLQGLSSSVHVDDPLLLLGIFASDSKQYPGFSSCRNHNYKPLGQSGIPWLLPADRLSDYQNIYDWNSKLQKTFYPNSFYNTTVIRENEYGKTGHSKIFTFLRYFILERNFVGPSCIPDLSNWKNCWLSCRLICSNHKWHLCLDRERHVHVFMRCFVCFLVPRYDVVEIGRGSDASDPTTNYASLSGSLEPFSFMIEESVGWVRFTSDYSSVNTGFSLIAEQVTGMSENQGLIWIRCCVSLKNMVWQNEMAYVYAECMPPHIYISFVCFGFNLTAKKTCVCL